MKKVFSVLYTINNATFEINIQARDWHEAEAILSCIKDNGRLGGQVCSSFISPEIAYSDIRPGDSLSEH